MLEAIAKGILRGIWELAQIAAIIGVIGYLINKGIRDFPGHTADYRPESPLPYDPANDPQHANIGPGGPK